jgi:hypothetical protein
MKGSASLKLTMERPAKRLVAGFLDLPTTVIAEVLTVDSVMRHVMRVPPTRCAPSSTTT